MKRKILLFVFALALILSPAISYAGQGSLFGGLVNKPAYNRSSVQTLFNANNEIGLSFNSIGQYYTERIGDNETGRISGINISASSLGNFFTVPLVYEHLGFSNSFGNFNYTDSAAGVNTTDNTQIFSASARIGKAFLLNSRTMLIPYLSYGYRKWDRNIASTSSVTGYQEIYSYNDLGLGLLADYTPVSNLVVKGRVQYAEMLSNSMDANNLPGYPSMTFSLGNRPVIAIGLGLDYAVYGPLHLTAGIKYVKTYFGKSVINEAGSYEPSSMTENIVYNAGLAYSF